jgi:hypothetical protein
MKVMETLRLKTTVGSSFLLDDDSRYLEINQQKNK